MTISECVSELKKQDNYLLLTHARPDGDTLCSAAALCSVLRRVGKQAWVYDNPETTESYAQLLKDYVTEKIPDGAYVISVDTATAGMLPLGYEGPVQLCIDHHGSNSLYARQTLLDASMAACGEIVLRLAEALCGKLTLHEAELLYIAVATDCGCFCYANTSPCTLRDAAHLVEYGVDNGRLNKQFFRSFSLSRLKLEGLIFAGMRAYRDGKITVAVVTDELMTQAGATEDDCDDLAALAGKVKGSVVAITVRQLPGGRAKASVRTNEQVNASDLCAHFGGGGHPMAAGCSADMGPFELADKLVALTNEIWK